MKKLIRVGTAGSLNVMSTSVVVLGIAATNQLKLIRNDWPQYDFPQIAESFDLLDKAYHIAKDHGMTTHVGSVCL